MVSVALSVAPVELIVISVVVRGLMGVVTGSAICVPVESVRVMVASALSHSELRSPSETFEMGTSGEI